MNMIKNKWIQSFAFCAIIVFLLSTMSLTVHADSIVDKGDNDTMETAETIIANDEKPSSAVSGSHTGQNVVRGYASTKDSDWYKVFLNAGTNYMTCNANSGDSYTFRITDSDGDTILLETHSQRVFGPTAYSFITPEAGYYYVELTGTKSDSIEYIFMIGSPTYQLASCKISCVEGSVSMTSGGRAQTVHFDGSSVSGLPKDAIASYVTMTGVASNAVSSIRVENKDRGLGFSLIRYTWYKKDLVSMNLPVQSIWTAEFGYNQVASFTPVFKVQYVYPVYDHVQQP